MNHIPYIFILFICSFIGCSSSNKPVATNNSIQKKHTDTIVIANNELEYEIIILEQGFERFLNTQPPQGYYGLSFLESKNYLYVQEYNRRVRDITKSRALYPQEIFYDPKVRYGMKVNFLLYNYFRFFEQKYNQKLK